MVEWALHHQKVRLWPLAIRLLDENAAAGQVFRQRHTQVRIVQGTQIVWFGRIGRADLARLHLQLGLAQASSLDQYLICNATPVSPSCSTCLARLLPCHSHAGALSSSNNGLVRSGSSRDAIAIDGAACDNGYRREV